jgi:hypothetical protein
MMARKPQSTAASQKPNAINPANPRGPLLSPPAYAQSCEASHSATPAQSSQAHQARSDGWNGIGLILSVEKPLSGVKLPREQADFLGCVASAARERIAEECGLDEAWL